VGNNSGSFQFLSVLYSKNTFCSFFNSSRARTENKVDVIHSSLGECVILKKSILIFIMLILAVPTAFTFSTKVQPVIAQTTATQTNVLLPEDYSGNYSTTWGNMTLEIPADVGFEGEGQYDGGPWPNGLLSGITVSGSTMQGEWLSIQGSAAITGFFNFTFSQDGLSFTGTYSVGAVFTGWAGTLSGTKVLPPTGYLDVELTYIPSADNCHITVTVSDKDTGIFVSGASLNITVTDPNGQASTFQGMTDLSGNGHYEWDLPWGSGDLGKTWNIYVEATAYGYNMASLSTSVKNMGAGLAISVTTDKPSYEQGETITVSGQVYYNGVPSAPDNSQVVLNVTLLPTADDPYMPTYSSLTVAFSTDGSGAFSVMPFAGYRCGPIHIEAKASLTNPTGKVTAKSSVDIEITPVTPVTDMTAQINALTALYNQTIPWGPVNFIGRQQWGPDGERWRQQITSTFPNVRLTNASKDALALWPESAYGDYEDIHLGKGPFDPEGVYICGGYAGLVLTFFNSIQFNPDPAVRALLKGLDYGPITRGSIYTLTYHIAVAVYPITPGGFSAVTARGFRFVSPDVIPVVFDAWMYQKPKTFPLEVWTQIIDNARPDPLAVATTHPAETLFEGYPMTGAMIYKNNVYWPDPKESTGPAPKTTQLGLNCPVTALITNSKGQRLGVLPNGTFLQEFSAQAEPSPENDGTTSWFFSLPDDNYNISITGLSTGTFRLMITGDAAGDNMLDYSDQTITQGAEANLTIKTGGNSPILTLPNGETVTPQTIQLTSASSTDWLPWIALTVIALLAVTFATLILRRKRRSRIQSSDTIPPPPPPPPPQ
jgi:hypothetical protein